MSITYKKILVATDFSELAGLALKEGERLAKAAGAEELHIAHVVSTSAATSVFPYSVPDTQLTEAFQRGSDRAQQRLDDIRPDFPPERVKRHLKLGLPARELSELAEALGVDLIVAASHGYGLIGRTFLGSVSSSLIRAAHCPVLVVGEGREGGAAFDSVLAAVDLSPVSEAVVSQAIAATEAGGQLTLLSLFEHPMTALDEGDVLPSYFSAAQIKELAEAHKAEVQKLLEPHPEAAELKVKIEVLSKAPPPQVILETAAILKPALIVLGTSGHNAWHRMILGSTATKVLADARCPVLVVPPGT